MKTGQVGPQWRTHLKLWIQLMHSIWLAVLIWEFLWLQHEDLCMITRTLLRSVITGFPKCGYQSTRAHSAASTEETISQFRWEQWLYPSYSRFLTPIFFTCLDHSKNFCIEQSFQVMMMKWRVPFAKKSVQMYLCWWNNTKACFSIRRIVFKEWISYWK